MKRKEVNNAECFAQSIEGLSDEQVEQFREAFIFMDKDSDGFISVKELGTILRVLGQNPTETEIQDMINVVDRDSNGVLDFIEFASLMVKYHGEEQEENELWMAFKVFDRDGTGFISATELKYALTNLGNALTEDEVDYMFEHGEAIVDNDGRLNYGDFLRHFLRTRQGAPLLRLAAGDDKSPNSLSHEDSASNPATIAQMKSQVSQSGKSLSRKTSSKKSNRSANHNPRGSTSRPEDAPRPMSPPPDAKTPPPSAPQKPLARTSSKKGFSRLSFKRKSSKSNNSSS